MANQAVNFLKSLRNDLSLLSTTAQERLRRGWRLFIDGDWCDSVTGATIPVIDPSSGETVSQIQAGTAADVDRAVRAARIAIERGPWGRIPAPARERVLHRLADLIDVHADLFAEIEAVDNGMPIAVAREINGQMTSSILRYMAGWATKVSGHTLDAGSEYLAYTTRQPVGVVGAIVPWNAPIEQAIWKVAPALAAGCSLVVKPSEHACLTVLMLAELAAEAGLPPGVLNVVTGLGIDAGEPLARHADVAKIAFTGSTRTGHHVQQLAGASGKRVHLELGGKSPVMIMADADLDAAIPRVASSIFDLSGQVCVAGSRIYVEAPQFNEVVDRLSARAGELCLGPGLGAGSELGPLITAAQRDRVMSYVTGAVQEGATVVAGGLAPGDGGFYVQPTVLVDVRQDMRCVQEEIFGPVVAVSPFDTEEEGVRLANDNAYGLAAYIWTRDIKRAHGLAKRIQCGKVAINCGAPPIPCVPEGGMKASGHGRDLGREGLEEYLELKSVLVGLL
jgi:phenylacetaldehyde dehydrogenase